MPTLEDGARAYAKAHPLNLAGKSWMNDCGGLMDTFNASFTPGFAPKGNISTAMHVMAGSTLFFPISYDDIQVGRFVFLSLPGSTAGHVGQVVSGEGLDALCFWASDALTVKLGNYIGFGTVRNYMAVKKATFKGVSEDYSSALPNLSAFSGGGATPAIASIGEENMAVKIWHYTAGGVDMKIVIDHLNMTYRQIVKGSIEDQGLQNDIDKGFARMDEIGQAAWAANFGAGQFLAITKPFTPTASGATDLTPVLTQLAAIEKLEAADQTALIAAINALPAEVRSKIIAAP